MYFISTFLTYYILLFIIVIFPDGNFNITKKRKIVENDIPFTWNWKLYFILISIIFVAGIRDASVGTDYSGYLDYYQYILDYNMPNPRYKTNEMGWEFINLFFAKLDVPAGIFFGLVAGFIWFFYIKGSYKYQFLLPLMLYFVYTSGYFLWTMSGLRQSIAIMIFFYSIKFIIERKPLHYFGYILLASMFHSSVIIMIPAYYLIKIGFNKKTILILYTLSLFLIGNTWLLTQITSLMYTVIASTSAFSAYDIYTESEKIGYNAEATSSGLGVILKIITTYYIIYMSDKVFKVHNELKIYYVLFIIAAISSNVFFSIELIGRLLAYFNISFSLVLASSLYFSQTKKEKLVAMFLIISYFLVFNMWVNNVTLTGARL